MKKEKLEDDSLMPYGGEKGFKGKRMIDVPAWYLLWLHDNGSSWARSNYPELFWYIKDNKDVLEKQKSEGK